MSAIVLIVLGLQGNNKTRFDIKNEEEANFLFCI